jgi:hypothetical protein
MTDLSPPLLQSSAAAPVGVVGACRHAGDVLAGNTLAPLGIPEVMDYTKISGTPVVTRVVH